MARARQSVPPATGVEASNARRGPRLPTYDILKGMILSGELEPGQPLVETNLAAWCGVSRTPIREALRRLQQDGLVRRGERGMVVMERSLEEILDIYDTRIVLEGMAGRVATERRTDHDLRLLHLWVERGFAVPADDVDLMLEVNQNFHRAIWRATHNESLVDVLERLHLHTARYPGTTLAAPGRWDSSNQQHQALVEAIEERDGDRADNIAHDHWLEARNIRLSLFADEVATRPRSLGSSD